MLKLMPHIFVNPNCEHFNEKNHTCDQEQYGDGAFGCWYYFGFPCKHANALKGENMIKEIVKYKTEDGMIFENKEDAIKNENKLCLLNDVFELLLKALNTNIKDIDDDKQRERYREKMQWAYNFIEENYTELCSIFNKWEGEMYK